MIGIRKILEEKEKELQKPPDKYHRQLKKKLDNLLIEITGVPESAQYQVNEILHKAISGEIKARTAVVAIHEIYSDFQQKSANKQINKKTNLNIDKQTNESNNYFDMETLYKSGYR